MEIDQVYFEYLIHTARAQSDSIMPNDIREIWLDKETNNFYERNKLNACKETKSFIPLPQQLLYPDDKKKEWKQKDLLREMNNQLLDSSNT